MTSAENSVSEPLEFSGGGYPHTPYKAHAFNNRDSAPPAPRYKKPSYCPEKLKFINYWSERWHQIII